MTGGTAWPGHPARPYPGVVLERLRRPVSPQAYRTITMVALVLLVAIVVMSMLALLSWRSLDGMTRTQKITQQRADDLLRMQAAMGQWAADLDALHDLALASRHLCPSLLAVFLERVTSNPEVWITHLKPSRAQTTLDEILSYCGRFSPRALYNGLELVL